MLYLIGFAHLDLKGYDRLSGLLNKISPAEVGLEESEKDFKFSSLIRHGLSDKVRFENAFEELQCMYNRAAPHYWGHSQPETMKLWMSSINFDHCAAVDYCNAKNIKLVCCDNAADKYDDAFKKHTNNLKGGLDIELLKLFALTPEYAFKDIEREYEMDTYPVVDSKSLTEFYKERDESTEKVIRNEVSKLQGDFVYVCGLDHIYGDYHPNLFDRLSDSNPTRIKLNDADKM